MNKNEAFVRQTLGKGMSIVVHAYDEEVVEDTAIFHKEFSGDEGVLPAIEFMEKHIIVDVVVRPKKEEKLLITVYEDFMGLEMSGEFSSEDEAKEFYASELGTFEEDIEIRKIEKLVDNKVNWEEFTNDLKIAAMRQKTQLASEKRHLEAKINKLPETLEYFEEIYKGKLDIATLEGKAIVWDSILVSIKNRENQ